MTGARAGSRQHVAVRSSAVLTPALDGNRLARLATVAEDRHALECRAAELTGAVGATLGAERLISTAATLEPDDLLGVRARTLLVGGGAKKLLRAPVVAALQHRQHACHVRGRVHDFH